MIRLFKLTSGGIDQLAALARTWLQAVREDRVVRIRFPNGNEESDEVMHVLRC